MPDQPGHAEPLRRRRAADGDQRAGASLRVMERPSRPAKRPGGAAAQFADTGVADAGSIRTVLRDQDALIAVDDLAAMPIVPVRS